MFCLTTFCRSSSQQRRYSDSGRRGRTLARMAFALLAYHCHRGHRTCLCRFDANHRTLFLLLSLWWEMWSAAETRETTRFMQENDTRHFSVWSLRYHSVRISSCP